LLNLASSTWDNEELEVVNDLLANSKLTMGEQVGKFEQQFAKFIGTEYAVMFNSGSSANLGMLTALKFAKDSVLLPGDHIIVPAVSWSTTYFPVNQCGFILDFVDVNLETLNIDEILVKKIIGPKTKAIFAVNLLGNPAKLSALKQIADEFGLLLIEDNCESLGAELNGKKTGSFGIASSHSFYFSHHICTIEGGMVTTDSLAVAETLISIRAHGWTRGLPNLNTVFNKSQNDWDDLFKFVLPGYNLRPLEISGAIGQIQLRKFPKFLQERRKNAEIFQKLVSNLKNYHFQLETGASSWFGFSILLKGNLRGHRQKIIKLLSEKGVETRPIVAGNFTSNPVMKYLSFAELPELPVAQEIHENGFFIGNHHFNVETELIQVYNILKSFELENS